MLTIGGDARVYRNLRRKTYSIQQRNAEGQFRVAGHRTALYLRDATFKVREAGRQRVIREGVKNVHAFICGEYGGSTLTEADFLEEQGWVKLTYNPFKYGHFVVAGTGLAVLGAQQVCLLSGGVYAYGVEYAG